MRHPAHALICVTRYLALCLAVSGCSLTVAADAFDDEWDGVDTVVAVGDIHGDFDSYLAVLQEAGVVNRRGNWTGEDTHLVQLGDVPDRGPDTGRIIEHLQKLQRQAERDGGMVHMLVGNHEFMNVTGDLRYVHPGEYEHLTDRNSDRRRDAYYQQTVAAIEARNETAATPAVIDEAFRAKWYADFPLGYVEHRLAWQPDGEINAWVAAHNSVIRINDMLFMHAGLGPEMLDKSIREINAQIRAEILGDYAPERSLGDDQQGPLWYRGLAMNPETDEAPHVRSLLETYRVNHVIVGHTPSLGVITPRFGGRVIVADTGMSAYYGGHRASLLANADGLFAMQSGETVPLPTDASGMIAYFTEMTRLKPDHPPLQRHLDSLLHPEGMEDADDSVTATPAVVD